jgi:type VI secretion system secreted protein VgrG
MPSHRIVASLAGAAKRPRRMAPWIGPLAVIAGVAVLFPGVTHAATPVGLGTAESFAVLAGSGITNTGPTTITGDVGSFPLLTQTGFGSVTLNGTNHGGDAVTQQAKTDLTTAYNEAAASGPPTAVSAELGGLTLTPGVYSGATLGITGTLTLDTLGDPAAVFIFQTGSTLITASDSAVVVLDGGTACNVFWQVASSATLGTNSHLIGSILASTSITATTGATVEGRLLAQDGAVTLDTNTITAEVCAPSTTTTTPGATTTTTTPGATTTTTPAATTTIAPVAATTTTAEVTSTGGGSPTTTVLDLTTATAGGSTTTSTPNTVPPSLARTGSDRGLPLLGGLMIALGGFLMGLANVRGRRSSLRA